jgi:primary-amine oxidase
VTGCIPGRSAIVVDAHYESVDEMQQPGPRVHPLDPLTATEVAAVTSILRGYDRFAALSERTRFVTIALLEPPKDAVLAWAAGGPAPRREAEAVILDRAAESTIEAVVVLDSHEVTTWRERTDIQPMTVVSELMEAEELVRLDPEFQAAMARRGITDFDTVQVDAWPAGHFGPAEETGQRLGRGVAFVKPRPGDNEWAHPVDGVIALFDLNRLEILRIDDHGVVPVPPESGNFDAAAAAPLRDDIAPLEITQPDGPGFTLDGHVLSWQRWQVHIGFTPREGLVLNQVAYEDGGRLRSILYRASLSEMVVPYGDPSPTHYFKNAFDSGENGVGIAASPLTRGCDCLGEIAYLDATVSDGAGDPVSIPNAICIHEEDAGVLWRHIEWRDGSGEVRRSRRLVISSFSAIGNYDYGFFWHLYQDGTIAFEVKLTGVLSTGAIAPGERPAHGTLVAPGLNAMVHQHFFNMRLDLDIDGQANGVDEVWTESLAPGPGNPYGNAFSPRRRRFATELEAKRRVDTASARWWEIVNPSILHRLGEPIGYRLLPGETTFAFAQPDAPVSKRAGFIREHLWVTPYRPDERYAAGEYPNLHPGGDGLPEWTSADRPIDDRDVVIWYTFGHHHVPRPEDWPIMPVTTAGFSLKPVGFFERNPALDVPPSKPHSDHCRPGSST